MSETLTDDFTQSPDAMVWAEAFTERVKAGCDPTDTGWVVGWIANAMARGEQTARGASTTVDPVDSISAMSDRELAENTFRLVCQVAGWQQGANTIIASMQEKMGELMKNPMIENLMSMMG